MGIFSRPSQGFQQCPFCRQPTDRSTMCPVCWSELTSPKADSVDASGPRVDANVTFENCRVERSAGIAWPGVARLVTEGKA